MSLLTTKSDFELREIIEGVEFVLPSPFGLHQQVIHKLLKIFDLYLEKNPIGEIFLSPLDVHLSENTIVQPDLIFLKKENLHLLKDWIYGTPDLLVEVVSKNSLTRDTVEKKALYEKYGVFEYWIVFPEQTCIEIFSLQNGKYELHSASDLNEGKVISQLLTGFSLNAIEVLG
ncbi:MAG: Uma2 family endonuclease [Leptospiraceae bacterium]|nr:Uma2 family endonuclease [Leptospiraceae bacterium]